MKYEDARHQLIQTWGQLSAQWGISRTMGQIHALLMITPNPLTADDIIAALNISRGNVSMNLRNLLEWGVVQKIFIPGDRKEYYSAEKDVWKMAIQITRERKRRELDPVIASLQSLQEIEDEPAKEKESEELRRMTHQLLDVAMQVEKVLDVGIRSGGQSIVRKLINVLR
jgi:DNA-binding transcriptional regulator GbsR (MarR family)